MSLAVACAGDYYERERRDPLAFFKFANRELERATRHLATEEIYVHSGNMGGKTTWGSAVAVALLRRQPELSGVTLPPMPRKVVGLLIVPSYKQSMGSSIQMVRQMIGGHESKETLLMGNYVQAFHVRQRGCTSDSPQDWSTLYVIPHDGEPPKGVRADFVWADEPPRIKLWQEAVMRARARSVFISYITATPLNRLDSADGAGWEPLLERFKDCLGNPVDGRLRIQTSIYDNTALSESDILRAERAVQGDPFASARLRGEHIDASGSCAFDVNILDRWMNATSEPERISFVIQAEKDTKNGKVAVPLSCELEVWSHVDPQDLYLLVLDPARGINDGKHDPDGAHVWSMRKRALVGRINQYLGGWGLGSAAVEVAKTYNQAAICVARGGGYGESVLSAIRQAGYSNLTSTVKDASIAQGGGQLGFTETHESRGRAIGALQQALTTGDAVIPSAAVISCLKNCIIDPHGKILAGPRGHDEDMICAGIALSIIQTRGKWLSPVQEVVRESGMRDALKKTFGRDILRPKHSTLLQDDQRWD
jgi:hypothetical protein